MMMGSGPEVRKVRSYRKLDGSERVVMLSEMYDDGWTILRRVLRKLSRYIT